MLEPIACWVDADGGLVVYRGQRRTLAAAKHGTPDGLVPVHVVAAPDEADRIIDQLTENIHRASMRASEERDAVEQLALLGVSPAQIVKRAAIPRPIVDAALTVAGTQAARSRMDSDGLTLDQAAAFAEFDGDEASIEELERALSWGHPIEHTVQRLRDRRTDRNDLMQEIERLRAEGLHVLDPEQVPANDWKLRLEHLVDADGEPVPEADWPTITGAALVVHTEWDWPETGGDLADDAEQVRTYRAEWICPDPDSAGLRHRSADGAAAGTQEPSEAEQQAKAETRRLVIANNQAWRSAETVRRDWLAGFITRRVVPAGAEDLICEAVMTAPCWLTKAMNEHHRLLRTLLGGDTPADPFAGPVECSRLATTPSVKAATVRSLAAVLTAWESSTGVHTWRTPGDWDTRVMTALVRWGYRPSDVEQLLLAATDTAEPIDVA